MANQTANSTANSSEGRPTKNSRNRNAAKEHRVKISRAKRKTKEANRLLFDEIESAMLQHKSIAYETQPPRGTHEMLTQVRDRAYRHWVYAAQQVDQLNPLDFWRHKTDAHGNDLVEPHPWVQYERDCRLDLADLGVKLVGLDIDERQVALEEAKATAAVAFLAAVVRELNLTEEQKQLLRPTMTKHAHLLEGTAQEVTT